MIARMETSATAAAATSAPRLRLAKRSLFDPMIVRSALPQSLRKLAPRVQARNPVMLVVLVGAVITTLAFLRDLASSTAQENVFNGLVAAFLWFTVLFANFAEAMAEGRGKAQAAALRKVRSETMANRRTAAGNIESVPSSRLDLDDVVEVSAGETIPSDGEIIEGIASVDESAITGESAPVIRESGGDRSAVTGGTVVLSDRIVVRITAKQGQTFIDRMIALVEGAARQQTPNEIALNILLAGLTIIFLLAVVTLQPFAIYSSNRQATEFVPINGVSAEAVADAAQLSSLADETPEGRSIVVLAKDEFGLRARDEGVMSHARFVPFTAETRMSGVDLAEVSGIRRIRKGAAAAVMKWVRDHGGHPTEEVGAIVDGISSGGGTPLVVAEWTDNSSARAIGVVHLKDIVKVGIRERFDEMRRMSIRTVMITGDNPATAKAIAQEAGVDDFLAEATPEDKLALIKREQQGGRLVAMTGDGTNDAPALAQADVGVAMNTGTQAAREAGNMVDLDSDPTKLIEVVEIGKQLLITRGALTTFSIANDVAKYFAIIPAMFVGLYPVLDKLNVMALHSPRSAILSAVIFNALVIVALIPLALRGVRFRAESASAMLRRNLLIYGLGGLVVPFIGIKLVDLVIVALGVS